LLNNYILESKSWEEKYFGVKVYNLHIGHPINNLLLPEKSYVYSLINSDNLPTIQFLEKEGFRYLVATVELDTKVNSRTEYLSNIFPVDPGEIKQLKSIAKSSFTHGRLRAEFPKVNSDEMHSEWIENCSKKIVADEVFVSHNYDIPTGFIAVKNKDGAGDIVLIAVNKDNRGSGIGTNLVQRSLFWARDLGLNKMTVRTELPNVAAIRMYESCGFKFSSGGIYLGKWT